jgi:hypothetical protein
MDDNSDLSETNRILYCDIQKTFRADNGLKNFIPYAGKTIMN